MTKENFTTMREKIDARHEARQTETINDPTRVYYCSEMDNKHDIFGFVNVNNEYIKTNFIRAYTEGTAFKFYDYNEVRPVVTMRINHALISGYIDLPNGERVYKHKDFKLMGGVSYPQPQQFEMTATYMAEIVELMK